jgi:hypothetical protein
MRRPQERRHLITPRRLLALALALLGQNAANARIVESYAAEDVVSERIGDGIVQFHMNAEAKADRLPSLALVEAARYEGPKPETFGVVPSFARDRAGRFVTSVTIEPGTSLYGTGQAGGPLLRNGFEVTEAWNTDAYGYGAKDEGPVHKPPLGAGGPGRRLGVRRPRGHDLPRARSIFRGDITFRADGPAHPVIVIDGRADPKAGDGALGALTGTIEMPPRGRWGITSAGTRTSRTDRVREVARDSAIGRSLRTSSGWTSTTWTASAASPSTPRSVPDPRAQRGARFDRVQQRLDDRPRHQERGRVLRLRSGRRDRRVGADGRRDESTSATSGPVSASSPITPCAKVREWWAGSTRLHGARGSTACGTT